MTTSKKATKKQGALLAPLNKVLGTETNVRIIRELDRIKAPIGTADLARFIEMDKAGVWRAVNALEELGVIEAIGVGGRRALHLRKDYPLIGHLAELFRAERVRFEKILAALADVARTLRPSPKSVWIEGPVAARRDQPGDPILIALLADSSEVGKLEDIFSRKITPIQKQFDVTIEVRGLTVADLRVMDQSAIDSLSDVILVWGSPPTAFTADPASRRDLLSPNIRLHKDREAKSLSLARALSTKLRRDPTLVRRALEYVRDRLASASPREAKELHEWRRILQTYSTPRLRRFLTDNSERALRLRQSSPFMAVLSDSERIKLIHDWESKDRLLTNSHDV
jgi:DNA-binding Lrp family transcriptional regulator